MNKVFGISLGLIMAAVSMGCAAQGQCLRQVNDLSATAQEQERQIRDLQGRQAVIKAEQAGTTLSSLASEGWDASVAAFGWVSKEAPIAGRKVEATYDNAADRITRAHNCYQDNGGADAHSYEEYRAIAARCLGN